MEQNDSLNFGKIIEQKNYLWLLEKDSLTDKDVFSPYYGDVTELNTERTILDIVGKETLSLIVSDLMDLLETSVAIYEKNGDYAFGSFNSGWCRLMDSASRKLCDTDDNNLALNCGKWLCHDDCWNNSAKPAILSKNATDIDCVGGLKLYGEPICVGDKVVGVINIGYGNPPTDDYKLKELSEKYSIDFETLKQKANEYKPRPDFIIEIAKKRLKSIAKLIGEIVGRKKIEQELIKAKEKAEKNELDLVLKNKEYEAINEELLIAKEKAERNEKDLRKAQQIAHIGSWYLDVVTNNVVWTEELYKMYGFDPKLPVPPYTEHMKLFTPESWEILSSSLANTREKGIPYELELKTLKKDGSNGWMWVRGEAVKDEKGEVIGLWGAAQDITDRKETEENLKNAKQTIERNEKLLNITSEITKVGGWEIDLNTNTLTWTKGVYAIHEVNEDYVPTVETSIRFYDETSRPIIEKAVEKSMKNGISFDEDLVIVTAKGNTKHVRALGDVTKDKFGNPEFIHGSFQDISAQKQFSNELIEAKEKAESQNSKISFLLEAAKTVLEIDDFIITAKKLFQSCKEITGATSGYVALLNDKGEENEVLFLDSGGMPCSVDESLPMPIRGLRSEAYKLSKAVFHNDFMKSEHVKFMPDGHVILKNVLFAPLLIDKKAVGLIGLANKPTDFNNDDLATISAFGELASISLRNSRNHEALLKAKEKAEESDRLKTAFLQNMSHEIRTPLNAISGFSGRLNKPTLSDEKRKSFVSIIQNSSNHLISIVSDILTISSLETKQEKRIMANVCINEIIVELLSIFKQQLSNKNISIYAKQELSDKQSEIRTDKTKITQILSNLLSNALKFTHEGFIEFGYALKNKELEFYVKDSGIGIETQHHDEIFERFRQADLSTNKKYGGTGLGLSISKGFVELLGGKIWVQSEPGNGSVFYFTTPYNPVNEVAQSTSPIKRNGSVKTVLVAEDEEYNFLFIEELLNDLDFDLIHAKDGKETVEICRSNPKIDLVLMDIKMPVMNGYDAAKLIKEFKPDLPIIAQSAYALEQEIEKYSVVFDDYITKPISEEILIEKVNKFVPLDLIN